ncbi:MAG: transposase, partial [Nitrososphaerota archaeon]|nr:transposase [Nitrososphaerota archaeon]
MSYVDQANALTKRRKENPEPARVHSQALQNVLKRVDTSFVNFFEGRTRYPHFKKFVSSMTYP